RARDDSSSTSVPPASPRPLLGFDTCALPSVAAMHSWKNASPFGVVGVYLGGGARSCPDASPDWVGAVLAQGWRVIPTYAGVQAPCNRDFHARIDPASASTQASDAVDARAGRAARAGIGRGAPIYLDLEAYDHPDAACVPAVKTFISAWVHRLHQRGYVAGLY